MRKKLTTGYLGHGYCDGIVYCSRAKGDHFVSCRGGFHVFPLLQGVHVGNTTAETERTSEQTDNPDCNQDANSVQQQKTQGPVKHTEAPRKEAERDRSPRGKPTGWTCGECLQWFPERDSYVAHVKTNHKKVRGHD